MKYELVAIKYEQTRKQVLTVNILHYLNNFLTKFMEQSSCETDSLSASEGIRRLSCDLTAALNRVQK